MIYNYGQNLGNGIFICISSIIFICLNILVWAIFRLPWRPHDLRLKYILFCMLNLTLRHCYVKQMKWEINFVQYMTSYVYVVWEWVYSEMYGVANNVFRGLAHTLVSAVIRVICHPNSQKLHQRELHQLPVYQWVQILCTHGSITHILRITGIIALLNGLSFVSFSLRFNQQV